MITDRTTASHNNAVLEIAGSFISHQKEVGDKYRVCANSVALFCGEISGESEDIFLPDVRVIDDENADIEDGVHVTPKFVAEVTSDSSKHRDYIEKMVAYIKIGVQEYWVVDLQRKQIWRYLQDYSGVPESFSYPEYSTMQVHSFPDIEIDLSNIFDRK